MDYRNNRRPAKPPAGHYAIQDGVIVTLKDVAEGYPLRPGLAPGDRVKVVGFDHGYYTVEKDGKPFTVFMANIV